MLSRRYVERRIEKRAHYNPSNGRLYVEGKGLISALCVTLAEAVCASVACGAQVLYLMPSHRWHDERSQYPGKADWGTSGVDLIQYLRNHCATISPSGSGVKLDIVPISLWFGSVTEETYMSDVIKAMAFLKDLLTKHFQPVEVIKGKHDEYRVELMSTPARTSMDLLRRKLPYGAKYDDLPSDVEKIIMENFGQARTELFRHDGRIVDNLHNYDGIWMYASCCRHMPVGRVIHDFEDKYESYVTGLYRVETRVPGGWAHVGLLPARNPIGGGSSVYPRRPGTLFESWCGHRDIKLALDYGWPIVIKERILWPDTQARRVKIGQDPLRHWTETLVMLREQIAEQYEEPIRSMLRDAFRGLLNHGVGRLYSGARKIDVYTQDFSEYPGDDAVLAEEYTDGSFRYEKKEELSSFQKENFKPHWVLEVWNQARWRVTKAALEVPYDQLISIRTDGLWTTCNMEFEYTGKPGCFRKKDLECTGPFVWPTNDLEFVSMIRRARHGG